MRRPCRSRYAAVKGLYRLAVNGDGTLTLLDAIKMKSPSWIVTSRDGRFAYATNEEGRGNGDRLGDEPRLAACGC